MINLLPSDYAQEEKKFVQKMGLLFVGLLIAAIGTYFLFGYIKLSAKNQATNKKLNIAQRKLKSVNERVRFINKTKKKKKRLKKKLEQREKIVGSQINWPSNLKELKNTIPKRSWLKEYRVKEHDQFYITGYTLNRQEVEKIVERFKTSPYFSDISLEVVNKQEVVKSGYQSVKAVHYKLTGVLNSRSDMHEMVE